ncbi:MAG: aspartate aminotransferase family protein [Verrucomicrobia bacterium]|nr:aspartate aminotransferase family protein [Verrucomicrobiota bacterium]
MDTAALYDSYLMKNYGKPPFAIARGEGSWVWDTEGRKYLDFICGIAVNTVGHSHPAWLRKVEEQLRQVVHVSNLFYVPGQAVLAKRIADQAGEGRSFFCNSGAEANEFLIKLARLWGRHKSGGKEGVCYHVLTAKNAFHGRTFGGMAATPQEKIQGGFRPMLDGFAYGDFNDVDSFAKLITPQTAAIMLETIQGEGGIVPATAEFLQGIRKLCDQHKLLLLIDEVQCGIGRTGSFFAYQQLGIEPDAIGMAKGLGGGFPIGATWVRRGYDELFTPGSHGTTYGGGPLACAAANAVLDIIEEENLLASVQQRSPVWHQQLRALVERYPQHLSAVRGRGYHVGLVVKGDPLEWSARFRAGGLLTVRGGSDVVRLMPPLTVTVSELNSCVTILDEVLANH